MKSSSKRLDRESAKTKVLDFQPLKIELQTSKEALGYLNLKTHGSDFVMGTPLKVQTGVLKIEERKIEDLADEKMLEKLKDIQEKAYEEGKSLGVEEGKNEAFAQYSKDIEEGLAQINELISSLGKIKTEMLSFNEAHILKMVYQMAKLVVHREVESQDEVILEVIRQAVSLTQEDENIVVSVNPAQMEYVENLKKQTGKEYEFAKKIKFVSSEDVALGGCLVETNYGVIDSQIDQRLEQLYKNLIETLPKIKDKIAV